MKGRLQGKHWRKQEGDTVLQGICIDIGETTVLEKGKTYFLFPNGSTHYYVSKFQNKNSHFGCFRKSFFQIVQEDEWSPEPPADNVPSLDSSKIYEAREKGYHATTGKPLTLKLPPIEEMLAYEKGFIDGKKIDYTRSTIDKKSD